jgi:hypothetical protein
MWVLNEFVEATNDVIYLPEREQMNIWNVSATKGFSFSSTGMVGLFILEDEWLRVIPSGVKPFPSRDKVRRINILR